MDATVSAHVAAGPVLRGWREYWVVAVDALGQEGQPSSPVWANQSYRGFYQGEWHQ